MTERPLLRVVRGQPTEEELAAVVTVLAAVTARAARAAAPAARSTWADPARRLRRPPPVGRRGP